MPSNNARKMKEIINRYLETTCTEEGRLLGESFLQSYQKGDEWSANLKEDAKEAVCMDRERGGGGEAGERGGRRSETPESRGENPPARILGGGNACAFRLMRRMVCREQKFRNSRRGKKRRTASGYASRPICRSAQPRKSHNLP